MPKHKTSKTVKPIESIPYPEVQTQPPQFLDLKIKGLLPHFQLLHLFYFILGQKIIIVLLFFSNL